MARHARFFFALILAPLFFGCAETPSVLFHEGALFRDDDVPYAATLFLVREYVHTKHAVYVYASNEMLETRRAALSAQWGVVNGKQILSALPFKKALLRARPRYVYTPDTEQIAYCKANKIRVIRVYNGAREDLFDMHFIRLTGPYDEPILMQNEVRKETRIPLKKSAFVVLDGDTFEYEGVRIRLLGVDAPEMAYGERIGQPEGAVTKAFVERAVKNARNLECSPASFDAYGRTLAHILIDATPLAVTLIEHALAYPTITRYGDNGFPEYAEAITNARKRAGRPTFQNPETFRRNNWN